MNASLITYMTLYGVVDQITLLCKSNGLEHMLINDLNNNACRLKLAKVFFWK